MDCLIPISDAQAADPSVSGGKGANSHTLYEISRKHSAFQVPSTYVLTTALFEQLVLPHVESEVRKLGSSSDPNCHDSPREDLYNEIRSTILNLPIPQWLEKRLDEVFEGLGSDIAVRSSATCEDGEQYSAAGQGYTALHQTTPKDVLKSIKEIWASLYSKGFTRYREEIGIRHNDARMAILLQEFINPCAAGVVHTFDQGTGRPGYCIGAQPGIGEGVVQPGGNVDHWFVGLLCGENDILEHMIPLKKERVVIRAGGGTRVDQVNIKDASLDDGMVLRIARVARCVKQHYTTMEVADHVDIEFAVKQQELFLLQARPKPFQGTENSKEGGPVLSTTTVDLSRVQPEVRFVPLSPTSVIAVEGAVTAKLAVNRGARSCPPGSIAVEHHTNNDYNAAFATLAGVITSDGDQTSHAAQHAYEKQIPCVVAASGALDTLMPYDDKVVTFDAGRKIVYIGEVPIKKIERRLDIWLTDPQVVRSFLEKGARHEIFRPWSESKAKRPEVFREDFEGHFRLRSNTYRHFQLDYYYKAWDRLTEILTSMFGCRTDQELKTQARQIKAIDSGQCLVHEVKANDPESIYHYLMSVKGFCTADLASLFKARREGFRRFAAFVHELHRIDRSNVEQVVEELINIFAWMHFGFWLDAVVESFANRQLQYIGNKGSFHNVLRDEAIADMDSDFCVDPQNPWIPTGQILNLSRQRDKDVYSLIELLRCDRKLRNLFSSGKPAEVAAALERDFRSEFEVIKDWSMKYKLTRENLDLPEDTEEYLTMLQRILDEERNMTEAMLSVVYAEHLREHKELDQQAPPLFECLRRRDEQLYLLCRADARAIIAEELKVPLSDVTSAHLDTRLPDVVAALHKRANTEKRFEQEAGAQVLHSNYPDLKEILQISKLQVVLREDGHHLIVPHQRKIAKMMLDAAKKFLPRPLSKPEEVFDLSTDEFVALFNKKDSTLIAQSLELRRHLLKAEQDLQIYWGVTKDDFAGIPVDVNRLWQHISSEKVGLINEYGALQDKCWTQSVSRKLALTGEFEPYKDEIFDVLGRPISRLVPGLRTFECHVNNAIQTLEHQIRKANLLKTHDAYAAEKARHAERLNALKRKAISKLLTVARTLYAMNRQLEATPLIGDALAEINSILEHGTKPEDPLLSQYYAARLMKKFVRFESNLDKPKVQLKDLFLLPVHYVSRLLGKFIKNDSLGPEWGSRRTAQILILNSTGEKVLLQKRGAYKRSFASTYTVSANAKVESGEDVLIPAAQAICEETGMHVELSRLERIQLPKQPKIHLTTASFYAFSSEEEECLDAVAQEYAEPSAPETDVVVRYNSGTRCLTVFSLNPNTAKKKVRATIEAIRNRTGLDYIFAFTNTDTGELLTYQLDEEEEREISATRKKRERNLKLAHDAIHCGLSEETLKTLDSDQMHFVPWEQVRNESLTSSSTYTTDLTAPYFSRMEIWNVLVRGSKI